MLITSKEEITQKFIAAVNQLITTKKVKNRKEIVDKLEWSEVAMSLVMAGKRQLPEAIAVKFVELYGFEKNGETVYVEEPAEEYVTPMLYYKKMYEMEVEKNKLLQENNGLMRELLTVLRKPAMKATQR